MADVETLPGKLIWSHDDEPGITRTKAGSGWNYKDAHGKAIRDEKTIDRIRALAIPPAYTDVWISPSANGHIQATGRDAKGRKQYRYHADWSAAQGETKFARMAAFGRLLPKIRKRVDADLRKRGMPREKALAAAVSLLEQTLIRVGNEEYAKTNKSYGLTTMRNRHAKVSGETIRFEFKGKSGVQHATRLKDRRLARVVKALQELPGQRLFQFVDDQGQRHDVTSGEVNGYLQAAAGEEISAKDFRTWAGTTYAAKALALQPEPETTTDLKKATNISVKACAGLLGNTPAVCRSAYIHPAVIEAFADNALPKSFAKAEGRAFETAVIRFLDQLAKKAKTRPARARKTATGDAAAARA